MKNRLFWPKSRFFAIFVCCALIVFGLFGCENISATGMPIETPASQSSTGNSGEGTKSEGIVMFLQTDQTGITVTSSPEIVRSHVMLLENDTLTEIITEVNKSDQPVLIQLNLFEDVNYVAELGLSKNTQIENSTILEGTLRNITDSQVTLVITEGVVAGNITLPGAFYQIRYVRDNLYSIQQIDQKKFPNPEEPG